MSKISYALLRRKRSPKTPNIPESTTFQDMHHHMRNMMTPDFSQTGNVITSSMTTSYTVRGSLTHRFFKGQQGHFNHVGGLQTNYLEIVASYLQQQE